ncbi:YpbF family protein [Bacillus sp. S/N-304-OC-R1]|uniref:YpbF family protein n=1 Tax=Bacillus sp. S/N-304-OC-R1 TaxID=2758034 RepID=UPI001C8E79C9|nr:YpbF family protein [Bacillus sp. S/N-304-OC-R1]MBY0122556.1 YpbF family protein [Bacillus sp. S/N-304-OC-R1]
MESSITMLDDRTDQATRQMLQKVVERKRKFDKLKLQHLMTMWITIFLTFFYLLYIYKTVMQPYSFSFSAMFSVYVNEKANLYFLVITVGLYGLMNLLREKREKAEKEYHALRCEIIDKSKDLWKKEDEWKNRHVVFEMMKKNYDINLFHENK